MTGNARAGRQVALQRSQRLAHSLGGLVTARYDCLPCTSRIVRPSVRVTALR
jgi:hypothetical protein